MKLRDQRKIDSGIRKGEVMGSYNFKLTKRFIRAS